MSVEGLIQSIVLIFSNVQHSRAEVLGALCGFITKQLQKLTSRRVRNRIKGFHESTSRGCIDLEAQSLRTFNEVNLKLISECHENQTGSWTYKTTFKRAIMAAQESLFRQMDGDVLSNG